jgi:hypothetical protein
MNNQVTNIFDKSVCLSCRQMRDYVNNVMIAEECHAVEHHLNNCALCSEAVEGMTIYPKGADDVLTKLTSHFLTERLQQTSPQVYFNSFAPVSSSSRNYKSKKPNVWLNVLIVSFIATSLIIFLYFENYKAFRFQNYNSKKTGAVEMHVSKPLTVK